MTMKIMFICLQILEFSFQNHIFVCKTISSEAIQKGKVMGNETRDLCNKNKLWMKQEISVSRMIYG